MACLDLVFDAKEINMKKIWVERFILVLAVTIFLAGFKCKILYGNTVSITSINPEDFKGNGNGASTLSDFQETLKKAYSNSSNSTYIGNASVSSTYNSLGITSENISQTTFNNKYNYDNPTKVVDGTCNIIASTLLLRKYMDTGALPESYNNKTIFYTLTNYAWSANYFTKSDNSGLSNAEMVKLLNKYIMVYEADLFTANSDSTNLWSTIKNYYDKKVKPVTITLNSSDSSHQVFVSAAYTETVTYKKKNILNRTTTYTKSYNAVRVCDGWQNSYKDPFTSSGTSDGTKRYSYYYFDSASALIKLK
jgi:hypothetical protein